MKHIDKLLLEMTERRSSDLHIKVGRRPISRVDGLLAEFDDEPVLTDSSVREIISEMIGPKQIKRFEDENELDLSYKPDDQPDRYRVNLFMRMGHPGIVMRQIPRNVKSLDELGFSPTLKMFAHQSQGLVLLTGPTGSGKSTTLAAMVREINESESKHIITVEDPIEFVHDDIKCLINQREIGIDTDSFAAGIKYALRQRD